MTENTGTERDLRQRHDLILANDNGFFGPFFSMPSKFLAGFSAASGIALIKSVGNLGGFAGPSLIGAAANATRGISGGVAMAGVALFVSAALVLLLPTSQGPTGGLDTLAPPLVETP